jgi:hypothetical protein
MTRSHKIALFVTVLIAHLGVSFALFSFVAPVEKAHLNAGVASIALKLLLFPLYAFSSVVSFSTFASESLFFTLYIGVFIFSGVFWATVVTSICSLWRGPRA